MNDETRCRVCGGNQATLCDTTDHGNQEHWLCERCGKFMVPGLESKTALSRLTDEQLVKLSGWVFERNREGSVPEVSKEVVGRVVNRPLPPLSERLDRLLLEAVRGHKRFGQQLHFKARHFLATTYSLEVNELNWLVDALVDQGLVKVVTTSNTKEITPDGYRKIDELRRRTKPSSKAFVAMSFDKGMHDVFIKGLQKGIEDAGYDGVRVDKTEHIDRIDDQIIALIRESAFIVADFTGHRGGVYFEAGFALGLGLPVIWTCRKSDMKDLHFDIRQYNTIDWTGPKDLAERLQHRIEATLGKGPYASLASEP